MFINTPAQQVSSAALLMTIVATAWRGAPPERVSMAVITAGWIITPFAQLRENWYQPQWGMLAVDTVTLMCLAYLTLHYKRHWIICATGFQAVAVMTHLAFLISPHALFRGYFFANFAIGYLLLGSVLGGIVFELRPATRPGPGTPLSGKVPLA